MCMHTYILVLYALVAFCVYTYIYIYTYIHVLVRGRVARVAAGSQRLVAIVIITVIGS